MFSDSQKHENESKNPKFFFTTKNKNLLIPAICELSTKTQSKSAQSSNRIGNFVILNIENDALDHIEQIILDIFNSILLVSPNFVDYKSPENVFSLAMSSNTSSGLETSLAPSTSTNKNLEFKSKPILNTLDAEFRVRQVLPRNYADEVCNKANKTLEKYNAIKLESKGLRFLRTLTSTSSSQAKLNNHSPNYLSSASSFFQSSTNSDLAQIFTFPIDRIHEILSKEIFECKLDLGVVVYLVSVLEFITTDVLHLSSSYVRYLNKYTITKRDVDTALYADPMLTKLFYSSFINGIGSNSNNRGSDNVEDNNDEDDNEECDGLSHNDFIIDQTSHHGNFITDNDDISLSISKLGTTSKRNSITTNFDSDLPNKNLVSNSSIASMSSLNSFSYRDDQFQSVSTDHLFNNLNSNISSNNINNSNEECTSDSSTICPETFSYEKLNLKYFIKVKELILEQNQHLNDLNVLRRIFMYSFKKFGASQQLIENIFGNINDVYECALRLADLLDDALTTQVQNRSHNSAQTIMIGGQFWELAEGLIFDDYWKYATTVTNYQNLISSLKEILNNTEIFNNLKQTNSCLPDITKYLLPKMLLGSVYHILYLYETIEYLSQMSITDEDKDFLKNTLDTLKTIKHELKALQFVNSKRRPIETSFRIFQPHQSQVNSLNESERMLLGLTNEDLSLNSAFNNQTKLNTFNSIKARALVHNISELTEMKWLEIESNINPHKSIDVNHQQQQSYSLPKGSSLSNLNKTLKTSSLGNSNDSNNRNIRYSYLYEGEITVCKSNQPISMTQNNQFLKCKLSKRYAYLFEDQIILVKRLQVPSTINISSSNSSNNNINPNINVKTKFKQKITLDKCCLKDKDDDYCFELQIFNDNNSVSSTSTSLFSFHHSSKPSHHIYNNQELEYVMFIASSPKEKYQWMSMLCYAQYKFTIDKLSQAMNEEHNRNNALPIPPKSYLFDQPDTPTTILFELPHQQLITATDNQNPYVESDGLSIKAATLTKIIERLTHHHYFHPKLIYTFLMFYREFASSKEVLQLLIKRYDIPDLDINSPDYNFTCDGIIERELLKRYKREYQQPIRLKVINVVKHWIERYYEEDFLNDNELSKSLENFIDLIGKSNRNYKHILERVLFKKKTFFMKKMQYGNKKSMDPIDQLDNLKCIFNKSIRTDAKQVFISSQQNFDNFLELNLSIADKYHESEDEDFDANEEPTFFPPYETHLETQYPFDILTLHPIEFARQATLMEFELFSAIKSNELSSGGWNKPDKKYKLAPNVTNLINLTNKFTYWYAKCIVNTQNFEERIAVVQRILDIASHFYAMNNFGGLMEIYSALELSSVFRLKATRKESGLEQHEMYEKMKSLFENHEKCYKDRLKSCLPPCIPFIGFHLKYIIQYSEWNKIHSEGQKINIIEQQKKHLKDDLGSNFAKTDIDQNNNDNQHQQLINISKYRRPFEYINEVLQYQSAPYKFKVHNEIRSFLVQDLEDYFEKAQNELKSSDKDSDILFKQNWSFSSESSISGSPPSSPSSLSSLSSLQEMIKLRDDNLKELVRGYISDQSKKIENDREVVAFPKIRKFQLKAPSSISASSVANNSTDKNLKTKNIKVNQNALHPKLDNLKLKDSSPANTNKRSFSTPRIERDKSLPNQKKGVEVKENDKKVSKEKSLNLFTAPILTASPSASSISSSSTSFLGALKQPTNKLPIKNSIKRQASATSISQSQLSPLPPPPSLPPPPPPDEKPKLPPKNLDSNKLVAIQRNRKINLLENCKIINTQTEIVQEESNLFSCSSSSASSTSSMIGFSNSQQTLKNNQSKTQSKENEHSLLVTPNLNLITNSLDSLKQKPSPAHQDNSLSTLSILNSTSSTSSIGEFVIRHGGFNEPNQQKLSISSSSSSAPNSPPPNYDDVFDSSTKLPSLSSLNSFVINNSVLHPKSNNMESQVFQNYPSQMAAYMATNSKNQYPNNFYNNNSGQMMFSFPFFPDTCSHHINLETMQTEKLNKNANDQIGQTNDTASKYSNVSSANFHTVTLPPPSTVPPPPPPPPSLPSQQIGTSKEITKASPSNELQLPPPIPPRPRARK